MSNTRIWALVLGAVLLLGITPFCNAVQVITKEQAMQAVRNFENNPDLQFDNVDLPLDTNKDWEKDFWQYNVVIGKDINNQHSWRVDAVTGEILDVFDFTQDNDSEQNLQFEELTEEQCQNIALTLARKNYRGFEAMNMQLASSEQNAVGWQFRWHQMLPWGAHTDNGVTIEVMPSNGKMVFYQADHPCKPEIFTPPSHVISQDQAWQIVKDFERNPNLNFESVDFVDTSWGSGVRSDIFNHNHMPNPSSWGTPWSRRIVYDFARKSGELSYQHWAVDAVTGEIIGIVYIDQSTEETNSGTTKPLTEEQGKEIGLKFARNLYVGFDNMNMMYVPNMLPWDDMSGELEWRQVLPSGAYTYNSVEMEIDKYTGKIISYCSFRTVECIGLAPQIPLEEAEKKAAEAAEFVADIDYGNIRLYSDPDRIYWTFDMSGFTADDHGGTCGAMIDAINGEIVRLDPYMGMPSHHKPKVIKTEPIWIRSILTKDSSVEWKGKPGAKLTLNGKTCVLKQGANQVVYNGKTIKLAQKITLSKGNLMVQANLFSLLTGNGPTKTTIKSTVKSPIKPKVTAPKPKTKR